MNEPLDQERISRALGSTIGSAFPIEHGAIGASAAASAFMERKAMNEETRAKAESVIHYANGVLEDDATELLDNAVTCARYVLAEHPADDERPIDEAWLLPIGFCKGVPGARLIYIDYFTIDDIESGRCSVCGIADQVKIPQWAGLMIWEQEGGPASPFVVQRVMKAPTIHRDRSEGKAIRHGICDLTYKRFACYRFGGVTEDCVAGAGI